MATEAIDLKTDDGTCRVHVFHPAGAGPWPGAIMYQDAFGVRPALDALGERLAAAGYYVLLPDLFYRTGYKSPGFALFSDPVARADFMTRIAPTVGPEPMMRDMKAFLAHLDAQPTVRGPQVGVVGYCMGGRIALTAAGSYPDRIAAAAAYHPGFVATDLPESPHLLAPKMKGRLYIGRAMEDASFDDAQKARLEAALDAAGVDYTLETYAARHGWVPSDSPVHDSAAAERHWDTLLRLLGAALAD